MLEIQNLKVFHGLIEAVHGIDLSIKKGQCVSLLGANGAGKTSTLSAITGTTRATGSIFLEEQDLTRLSVEDRFRKGVSLSPEGRRIFSNLTVYENLQLGASIRTDEDAKKSDIAHWLDRFPILGERVDQSAGTLSGGEQQMLAIARALLSRPKILLLDEPSLGLAPMITKSIFEIIKELKETGGTILLVEQNAKAAIAVSDYVYVLNNGELTNEGSASDFAKSDALMSELTGIV